MTAPTLHPWAGAAARRPPRASLPSPRSPWPARPGAAALALGLAAALAIATAPARPQESAQATPPAADAVPRAAATPDAGVTSPLARDLREEVRRIPVTVSDAAGRSQAVAIAVTMYRPAGNGPFPVAIFSHGRSPGDKRAQQGRQRFEVLSRWLVAKGFAVFVPTRAGYGDTFGDFDPEHGGRCSALQLAPMAAAASDQVLAVLQHARTLPWVDARRWVALGQSVGGLATVAVAARNPPGLVAAINLAGGTGGNPDTRPGDPCSPHQLERLFATQAAGARVPMLWLYWHNDRYWGADVPKRWLEAWQDGGGQAEFHLLPAVGTDGHNGPQIDMDTWVPLAEAYLARAGFGRSGIVPRPPPTDWARLADTAKVPASGPVREQLYRAFLAARAPRAFAISPGGSTGWASGDWALGRALGYCQSRRGEPCRLYAVDDDVVWTPQ